MENFIRELLEGELFKKSYIDELIKDENFLNNEDVLFYNKNKSKSNWKTRLFKKLGFKSFNKQSDEFWTYRGYTKLEARDLSHSNKVTRKLPTPMQKEFWIEKGMTEEEAIFKIKSSRKTQREYWISRGFTKDESDIKIKEYQLENSKKLKNKKISTPELFNDINWNQNGYWLKKGLSLEEAVKKISELQSTFSKEKCIEKYGEVKGMSIWKGRQEKWFKSYKKTNYSKISQNLFWNILESGDIDSINEKSLYFGTYNKGTKSESENMEYTLNISQKVIKPDFLMMPDKKIIEFDGVYWHDHKRRNKPENEKREKEREESIIESGYSLIRVNELDYVNNPTETIKKCINFLNSK